MLIKIIIVTLVSLNASAFNSDNCKELYKNNFKKSGDWMTSIVSTFASSVSSSVQATSSWGECSATGSIENNQKIFIAQSLKILRSEIAKGGGEFTDTFADISKCNSIGHAKLKRELQKNFDKIFEEDNENIEMIYLRIFNVMKNEKIIVENCRFT